jgi:ABC-type bacteriocin/lantibiotic exporter with double-glycine peptidase domain
MNIKDLIHLLEKYTEFSDTKIDFFDLVHEKARHKNQSYFDVPKMLSELNDLAHYVHFAFLQHRATTSEFASILKANSFPIIVFEKTEKLVPVIISPDRDKGVKVIRIEQNKVIPVEYPNIAQLIENIHTVGSLVEKSGSNIDIDPKKDEKQKDYIFFLSGFPITSLAQDINREGLHHNEESDDHSNHHHITPFARLLNLLKSESKEISQIYFFAILIGLINLVVPLGIQAIIGLISGGLLINSVVVLITLVVLATMLAGWLQLLQLSTMEVLQQRVFTKAALEFCFRIPKIKMESIGKHYAPELMNRFFDVLNIQKSLPKILIDLTTAALQIVFGLIMISFYHPLFVLFGLILIVIIFIVFYFTGPKGLKTSIKESIFKYKVVQWLEEMARTLSTFKLAGFTNMPISKTDHFLTGYLKSRQSHFRILRTQFISIIVFKVFITAGLLVLGSILVIERQINLGQFVAAEIIILLIISSVEKLISTIDVFYDLLTALDKVGHITDIPLEDTRGVDITEFGMDQGVEMEIRDLQYKYPGTEKLVIKDINLKITPNESVCLAGYNGSGKSTFMKLISGLLHEYTGIVNINGMPLKDINLNSYRDLIGDNLSYQDIFEGTLEENITLGKNGISLDDLLWSIQKVGLSDFVNRSQGGLKTMLTSGGHDLPVYICKKIILARSIVEKPKLLVMDDFYYPDRVEKREIVNFLTNEENGWTLIIVSNDPVVMQMTNRTIFFKDGEVVEQGPYDVIKKTFSYQKVILGLVE